MYVCTYVCMNNACTCLLCACVYTHKVGINFSAVCFLYIFLACESQISTANTVIKQAQMRCDCFMTSPLYVPHYYVVCTCVYFMKYFMY